ncbi:MAG: hypothetical protein SGJ13_17795, partial [Actinomycetota bacterium]|nr:hypothetical protein [Actinomycetota bacterium]
MNMKAGAAAVTLVAALLTTAAPATAADDERTVVEAMQALLATRDDSLVGNEFTASATVAAGTDARFDNGWGYDGRGDIINYGIGNDAAMVVGLQTDIFESPTAYNWRAWDLGDPAWVGPTAILWQIDTNGDLTADYLVFFFNVGGSVTSAVTPTSDPTNILCFASPSWDAASGYFSSFARSCVGNPASARVTAYMYYETRFDISE